MQQLTESYRATIRALIQRSDLLTKQLKEMPVGPQRDLVVERHHMLRQELRELARTLSELEEYLEIRGMLPEGGAGEMGSPRRKLVLKAERGEAV